MSTFQAKFRLSSLDDAKYAPEGAVTATFMGVQGEPFGSATPSAYCQMTIHNAAVSEILKEKYLAYLSAIKAHRDGVDAGAIEKTAAYPTQPEFLITFAPTDETVESAS